MGIKALWDEDSDLSRGIYLDRRMLTTRSGFNVIANTAGANRDRGNGVSLLKIAL